MIKYEDVSIDILNAKYYSKEIQKIIDRNRLKTIKDLLSFMKDNPEIDFSSINNKLKKVIEQIDNNVDKEPTVYKIKEYEDNILNYNDKINYGNILLLKSPTSLYSVKYFNLMYTQISKIINDVSLCTQNGENYLVKFTHKLGYSSIPVIVDALNMYKDQIVRQSKLTSDRHNNLFKLDMDEKVEIVDLKYSQIINYLMNNTEELIWCKLTDSLKKKYESSIINDTKMDNLIKSFIIKSVANYTTLPELEDLSKDNYKVLNRFIKK